MKKRLLWLCHWESPYEEEWKGGMGKYMHSLSRELSRNTNTKIDILTPNFSNLPSKQTLHSNQVDLIRLEVPAHSDIRNPEDMKRYAEAVSEFFDKKGGEYSLVHAHYWSSHLAGEALAAHGLPYILQLHQLDKPMRATFQSHDLEYRLNEWRHETEKSAVEKADRTIFVSDTQLKEFIEHYYEGKIPAPVKEKIHVILNGTDVNQFKPMSKKGSARLKSKYDLSDNSFVIGYCGRLDPDKAVDRMIHSIPFLLDKLTPDQIDKIRVMITGKGSDVKYLEKLVRQLGIKDRVQFYGYQTGSELLEKFQISDVGVVTSIHETFGLSATEFMACSKPTIVWKGSGGPEEIVNGTAGRIVSNYQEMADTLYQLYTNPESRKNLGERARRRCIKIYNWKRVAREVTDLYEEMLSDSR